MHNASTTLATSPGACLLFAQEVQVTEETLVRASLYLGAHLWDWSSLPQCGQDCAPSLLPNTLTPIPGIIFLPFVSEYLGGMASF